MQPPSLASAFYGAEIRGSTHSEIAPSARTVVHGEAYVEELKGMSTILIQCKGSGYFLQEPGAWTTDPREALPFTSEWAARVFAQRQGLEEVQIVEVNLGEAPFKPARPTSAPKLSGAFDAVDRNRPY